VLAALKNAARPVNLIYRAALDNKAPVAVRKSISAFVAEIKARGGAIKVWVSLKFNWSHGHSTPILVHAHGGGTGAGYWTPPCDAYQMAWMVRNEDFFALRWGGADFIRAHIALNGGSFVGGYTTGSEEHIPAFDYATTPGSPTRTWEHDFQRQWLYYMEWGRLLFDPATPDEVFATAYTTTLGLGSPAEGHAMLAAMHAAAIMPLRLASFVYNTYDFTLYAEGFTAAAGPNSDAGKDNPKGFISITTLMRTKTLDPTLQSVPDFVVAANASLTSPLALADELTSASATALHLLTQVADGPKALVTEKQDISTWAHLAQYFGLKLQAAVALQRFVASSPPDARFRALAVSKLLECQAEWKQVVAITSDHLGWPSLGGKYFLLDYGEGYDRPGPGSTPHKVGMFSWAEMAGMVARDIDLANATVHGAAASRVSP
jgi:hypothetical protein